MKIVNQVLANKGTGSGAYRGQRKPVPFAIFIMCIVPVVISCFCGEIGMGKSNRSSVLIFPDTSKYTVVFDASYGQLKMDLEAAVACMLSTVIPADYEQEAIMAQAILLRTDLLDLYEESDRDSNKYINLKKTNYTKRYFTFLEQKEVYKEEYEKNLAVYRNAVQETTGMYIKNKESGHIESGGWFAVSMGVTREGVICDNDYKSPLYYSEISYTQKELTDVVGKIRKNDTTVSSGDAENGKVEEIHFVGIEGEGYAKNIVFEIILGNGEKEAYIVGADVLCDKLNLISPCIEEISEVDYNINITVKGVGHGSGMSLYGANELAKEGKNYEEILNYFFTNIAIDKIE